MKKFLRVIALVLSINLIFLFSACSPTVSTFNGYYFNTGIHIETHDKQMSIQTKEKLETLFSLLESEFDKTDGTFTGAFNDLQLNQKLMVSALAKEILDKCAYYHTFSDGAFNIAVAPLLELWQFAPIYPVNDFTIPTDSQINDTLLALDYLNLSVIDGYVTKTNELTKIDFGGMLKGYASEMAMKILSDAGHTKGYVNIGSSSLSLLNVPSLKVRHPENNSSQILEIVTDNLKGYSVSTSGTYEKYYEIDGKVYSHIINSKTGKCADTNVISATVIGKDGAFCDAMTTALCLQEYSLTSNDNALVNLINKITALSSDYSCYAIYNDGVNKKIITNKTLSVDFTLLDNTYQIVKI